MKAAIAGIATGILVVLVLNTIFYPKQQSITPNPNLSEPAKIIIKYLPEGKYLDIDFDWNNNPTHIKDSQSVDHFFVYNELGQLIHYTNTAGSDIKLKYFDNEWYIDDNSGCDWIIR